MLHPFLAAAFQTSALPSPPAASCSQDSLLVLLEKLAAKLSGTSSAQTQLSASWSFQPCKLSALCPPSGTECISQLQKLGNLVNLQGWNFDDVGKSRK